MRDNTLRFLLLAASMTMLTPAAANAAGLGRLTVLSTLGQPLNAEVELLSVQKNETITARLASQEVYSQANAQYNNALTGTRVTVEKRPNGQVFLRATTPRVVSEPFLELLIEINSENGRVLRQYTALLDPPGYGGAASELPPPLPPAVTSAPQSRAAPAPAPSAASSAASSSGSYDPSAAAPVAAPAPAAAGPSPARRAAPRASARSSQSSEAPAAAAGARQYGPVKPGETLGRIARTVKPEGVTLEQTLVALHRQNPDAFIKKNMNLVRSGKILSVPEANEIASLPQRQAVQEVRLQVADWNAFRGRVADRVARAPQDGSITSGRIGSRVADASAGEGPRDTVRLSRGEGKGKGKAASGDRVRALEEEAIAREKQLAEANSRIGQLEQIIKDSQRAVELKASPLPSPKGADKAGDKVTDKGASKAVDKSAAAPTVAAPIPAPPAKAPADQSPSADIAAAPSGQAGPAKGPDTPPAPTSDAQSVAKAKKAPPPAPAPEFDIVGTIMDEPLYLAAGGAVLGLGVLALVMARRRRTGGNRGADEAVVKIAPSLAPASAGTAGSTPVGGGIRTAATPSTATPAAARPTPTSTPTGRPAEPARSTPLPKPAPSPAAAPAAAKPREADDNDLDFNVGMRRGGAAGAAAAPPQDMTPRAPGGEPARRVSEAARTVVPPPPTPEPARSAGPAVRAPEAPRTVTPPPAPAPAPKAVESAPRAPEPPARAPEAPPAAPARPDHAARASEVLRAAQAQSRASEAKPLEPLMPDFALDAAGAKPSTPAPAPAAPAKDPNVLDFDLDPLPAAGGRLNMDKVASEPPPKVDFKLDLADLDLNAPPQRTAAPAAPAAPAKDDHWYDVQQKFDLAKAYEEMGDKDGARDILQEVVREGDAEQKSQAKKLLGPLS